MKVFRTLDIYIKVAINFMSQTTVLRAKDLSLYKRMLTKMLEYGVAGKRKPEEQGPNEATELPNLLGEKSVRNTDMLETSGPSSEAMKAFFEASLTTVGASELPEGLGTENDSIQDKHTDTPMTPV